MPFLPTYHFQKKYKERLIAGFWRTVGYTADKTLKTFPFTFLAELIGVLLHNESYSTDIV